MLRLQHNSFNIILSCEAFRTEQSSQFNILIFIMFRPFPTFLKATRCTARRFCSSEMASKTYDDVICDPKTSESMRRCLLALKMDAEKVKIDAEQEKLKAGFELRLLEVAKNLQLLEVNKNLQLVQLKNNLEIRDLEAKYEVALSNLKVASQAQSQLVLDP